MYEAQKTYDMASDQRDGGGIGISGRDSCLCGGCRPGGVRGRGGKRGRGLR